MNNSATLNIQTFFSNFFYILLSTVATLTLALIPVSVLLSDFNIPGTNILLTAQFIIALNLGLLLLCSIIFLIFKIKLSIYPVILVLFLVVIACSTTFSQQYSFAKLPFLLGELSVFSIFGWLIWQHKNWLLTVLLGVTCIIFIIIFIDQAAGRVLHSDDHATFLYRLEMLKANFPYIPFYNPLWNTGIDERYFFATGTLNIFFLLAPILYYIDLWNFYNIVPIFINYLLAPISTYIAARLIGLPTRAAAFAGLLALSSSIAWYNWSLHFGPLGFLTTACLTPLLGALCVRAFDLERQLSWIESMVFILIATLVVLWSPGGIIFLPAILFISLNFKILRFKPKLIFIGIMLLIINLPWILVFWSASEVSSFLTKAEGIRKIRYESEYQKEVPTKVGADLKDADSNNAAEQPDKAKVFINKAIVLFKKQITGTNALLLILALPALLILPAKVRVFYLTQSIWLLLLGTMIAQIKPQLELDRMLVVLFIFLSVPVAAFVEQKVMQRQGYVQQLCFSIFLGFVLLYVCSSAGVIMGKSHIPMQFRTELADHLVDAISNHTKSGRSIFAGFVLHELDGGHIAPLTLRTDVPLIASSPVHKYWRYTDVTPREFLAEGELGLERYFDLVNATTVVVHDRKWRKFFLNRPELYQQLWQERSFTLFQRKQAINNYFLEGSGNIHKQTSNQVELSLDQPEAIIKFNYFPFLHSSACKLGYQQVAADLYFVKLSECPIKKPIIIKAKPAYARIKF